MKSKTSKRTHCMAARSFANGLLLVTSLIVASQNRSVFAAEIQRDSSNGGSAEWLRRWRAENKVWRGVHVMVGNGDTASELMAAVPKLGALGVNALVLEVNYCLEFESHPELHGA